MSAVWSSVIAVGGTLSGGVLTGALQAWLARAARRETRGEVHRSEALAAVAGLVVALADHRRAMWVREDVRLSGADRQVVAEARAASHVTRAAITGPLVTVSILAPALASAAQQAVQATYVLRDAADHGALAALRDQAVHAVDHLVQAAGRVFAECGTAIADVITSRSLTA